MGQLPHTHHCNFYVLIAVGLNEFQNMLLTDKNKENMSELLICDLTDNQT